jgi:hypothetical protein
VALVLCCSGLENPFDSKSPNYVSDTTLVRIMQQYDSTFVDTSIVFDTVIHVDTVIRDSIRIVPQFHYDTTYELDTIIDTVHHRDTTIFIDTVIHYDSVGYIDTLHIRDTLHFRDTVFHYDTLIHVDSTHFLDSIHYRDTTHFRDTIHFKDTTTHYDTLVHRDTLTFRDSTHFRDTIHFRDTLFHYDTLVHRDTIIDTVRFYRTQPFIYLVSLPDSSIFNTFNYGASYSLAVKCAGINPAIISGYSFKPDGGNVWNGISLPWALTFNTISPVFYTLRVTTDSGIFANSYALRCNPTSAIRGSKPVLGEVLISTLYGFQRTFSDYAPVCTLWTDSAVFTPFPDRVEAISILPEFSVTGGTSFDYYISKTGSYNTASCEFIQGAPASYETALEGVAPGTHLMTCCCRSVAPDTSLWSIWSTFVFVVRDGR